MENFEVLEVKKDDDCLVEKIVILSLGLELTFRPDYEKKKMVEGSRVYVYGGHISRDKMHLPRKVYTDIIKFVYKSTFGEKKKTNKNNHPFPGEYRLVENAQQLNYELNHLKGKLDKKSNTFIIEEILKNRAKSKVSTEKDFKHLPEKEKKWLFRLNSVGVLVSKEGWLIINKSVLIDIDSAIRMQDHILDSYIDRSEKSCAEIKKLGNMTDLAKKLNKFFREWKNKSDEEKLASINLINQIIGQLRRVRNEFKIEAREQVEHISKLKDSLERDNPGALATRSIAIISRTEQRFKQIREIIPQIEARKKVLSDYKDFAASEKMLARKMLDEIIKTRNFSFYLNVMDIKINRVLSVVGNIFIAPVSYEAKQATFFMQRAKECISAGQHKKAKKLLRQAISVIS